MKSNIKHKNVCGIYAIKNKVNGKVYIGKSVNIHRRMKTHITNLNRSVTDQENEHLIRSWHKHGKENFEYEIVCECTIDELKEKELFYIQEYESTNRDKGYNFRIDSEGGMIPLESTRKKLSLAQIKRFKDPAERKKLGDKSREFWKNNPDVKEQMIKNVSKAKEKYEFFKLDKDTGEILESFDNIKEIIANNPTYKWQNIYAVCNGYKPSMYGFKWTKKLKI
jgi:group I intron endonuclease